MKNEDTFSLTSLKDDHQQFLNKPLSKSKLKLPSIKSQTSLSKATTASKTFASVRLTNALVFRQVFPTLFSANWPVNLNQTIPLFLDKTNFALQGNILISRINRFYIVFLNKNIILLNLHKRNQWLL